MTGKFGLGVQNEAGYRLTEFCQKNALVIANILFQEHKRQLYTWISLNGKSSTQQKQDLELTGSDHWLLFVKVRLKLKNVRKTTSH